jgi:HSP20 family molecular chaperone IbpA
MPQIRQTIDVNVPLSAAYHQWTQFKDFPRFMEGVHEVRQLDDTHVHWRASRDGAELEWDSEITDQVPDQLIVWRDVSGPGNYGSITFQPLKDDATRVELLMELALKPETADAINHEQAISRRIEQDLIRFKQMLETQIQRSGVEHDAVHQAKTSTTTESPESQKIAATPASPAWLPSMLQGWEEPMVMMRKMSDEMDQLFERFLGRPMAFRLGQGGVAGKWMPAIDMAQRGERLVVFADLPGVRKEDVKIEIRQSKLILEGERPPPSEKSATPPTRRSERNYGHFYRMIPLPEGVDAGRANASMREGVLEITLLLPPQETRHGQRIEIGPH